MEKVIDGLYQVGKGYQAFIVDGDEGVTLVDTGLPKRTAPILEGLKSIGRTVEDVRHVVLTHCHVDHVGGLATVVDETGADVFCSAIDSPAVRGEAPVPPPPVAVRFGFLGMIMKILPDAESAGVDHEVQPGETLRLTEDFQAIATPGHTPGHMSFLLDRAGGVMIVGDAASRRRSGDISRGLFNAPFPEIDASIEALAAYDFEVAVFGHAAPIRAGAAAAFAAFAATL